MDCRIKFYSNAEFSRKGGSFHYKILFFWYFSDFQRLVRVRFASMTNTKPSRGVVCHYYCHNPGHVLQNCRKLQNKNRRFQSVHHQKSPQSASTSISTLVESGIINTCFISSSSTWVIDSGVTDHMIGNSSLFTVFQSHPSTSIVTLADGSTSYVLRSKAIHPTPLITLTSVLSLPQFSFNLISVSKLTRILYCSISLFFDHCLI